MTTSGAAFRDDFFYAHWSKYLAFVVNSHIKHAVKAVKHRKKPQYWLDDAAVLDYLEQSSELILKASKLIAEAAPDSICPKCDGEMCRECRMAGWMPKPKPKKPKRRRPKKVRMWMIDDGVGLPIVDGDA